VKGTCVYILAFCRSVDLDHLLVSGKTIHKIMLISYDPKWHDLM
jgi:hypothetical protein